MMNFSNFVLNFGSTSCREERPLECDTYRTCEECIKVELEKHDAEIRAEIIDEFVKFAYENGIGFSFMGKIKEDGTSDVPDKLNAIKFKFIEWLKEKKE